MTFLFFLFFAALAWAIGNELTLRDLAAENERLRIEIRALREDFQSREGAA